MPVPVHGHLRLLDAITPGGRRPTPRRPGGPVHANRGQHARDVRAQAVDLLNEQNRRLQVLGIKPELVLVLESNRQVKPEDVESAGLQILEMRSDKVLVAFATDPELSEFLKRCDKYGLGPRGRTAGDNERPAEYESLFDAIELARPLSEKDVLDPAVLPLLADASRMLRLDISCWCPEDTSAAERRFGEVKAAVAAAGGRVLHGVLRHTAGLSLMRAEVPAGRVRDLAQVDRVRQIAALPQPDLTQPAVLAATPRDLPVVVPPAPDAPVLAVIDSGAASSHPLLAPAVISVDWAGGIGDGGDRHGHGTMVSSLALFGSLEPLLTSHEPARPAGRLVSIRVLDDDALFPEELPWEVLLSQAMEAAVQAGARVINLSLGDPRFPYKPPRPTAVAALIDQFARQNKVVVIVSAGNYTSWNDRTADLADSSYPRTILEAEDSGLLDPAPAALALTVGALCSDHGQGARPASEDVDVIPAGGPGRPSPVTRAGPGPMGMVKPELVAPGGSLAVDTLMSRVDMRDPSVRVIGAGTGGTARLLAADTGTSYAAPLVTHAALRVLGHYPRLSANAVRALLLCSAQEVEPVLDPEKAAQRQQQRRITGYGRVSARRAEVSEDHRAVLIAEDEIIVDDVHLYVIPVPATFYQPGGWRRLTAALAYDPPVRTTRLDYLASHMDMQVYFGVPVATVRAAYVKEAGAEDQSPPELEKYKRDLQPSSTHRGKGANQFCAVTFRQRLDSAKGTDFILAIRNTNRWDTPGARQAYALAVQLERDTQHADLYAELRAQLEAVAEIEIGP
jgi:Subtilase family